MRILWLKTELLHPVDKGGKIRTYQMLRELRKRHHITYLTLDDGTGDADAFAKADEYAHETVVVPHRQSAKFSLKFYVELAANTISRLPYALQKYESREMRAKIAEMARSGGFDVVVCDFLTPAVNLPERLELPIVLFQHNVEAMIWRRHFETEHSAVRKRFLRMQWRRMFEYEKRRCADFDWVAAVSEDDARTMRNDYGIENVSGIPTGVDTEFFSRSGSVEVKDFSLVFTGSMDWLPNEDAIRWFAEEVLPLIRQQIPEVTLTVVGRNPFPGLIDLGEKDPFVVVTGRVEDVRPFMEAASVYIVPIRIGGGTRLKIYEAMAMEIPIVSTTVGAEGLPVKDGEEILLRDTAGDFANAVIKLLKDKEFARGIGEKSARTVREKFGWQTVADAFEQLCEKAVERHNGNERENPASVGTSVL